MIDNELAIIRYKRSLNQNELKICLAVLESGATARTFVSGQTAVGAVRDLLDMGAPVIIAPEMQGTRYRMLEDMCRRTSGLVLSYVDTTNLQVIVEEFREETRMIRIEKSFLVRVSDDGFCYVC